MKKLFFFVVTAIAFTFTINSSWAKMQWINNIPNSVKFGCGNCHINWTGGGQRNPFGLEIEHHFIENDNVVWQTALAIIDSDNDGKTNGEELLDPNGAWRINDPPPGDFTNVTNPGVVDNLRAPTLQSPSDKFIGVPLKAQFTWTPVSGAENYRVEISEDINFATVSIVLDSIPTNKATNVDLLPNKDYYWRARAQASFAVGPWSAAFGFKSRLAAPTPIFPVNNASGVSVPTTFNWNFVEGTYFYFLEVSTSTDFSSPLVVLHDLTDTTVTLLELKANMTYYWRVRADDSPQLSDWSPTMKFDTQLPGPTLLEPINGALGVEPNVKLTWNKLGEFASYNIQIDTNDTFSQPAIIRKNVKDTTLTIEELEYDRVYYWRVNGGVEPEVSKWSDVWSFRVKPPAPKLVYPEDGAQDIALKFFASWEPVSGADSYNAQLATDAEFSNVVLNLDNVSEAQVEFCGLNPSVQYYWRARAVKGTAISDWSPARTFTTNQGSPALLTPENGATEQPLELTLIWEKVPTAIDYTVQMDTVENFSGATKDEFNIGDTSVKIIQLSEETTFYWRVRSNLPSGPSPWSETRNFRTKKEGSAYEAKAIIAKISPNPASGRLVAETEFMRPERVRIYVVDILGKVCLELGNRDFDSGAARTEFDIKTLPPGSYRLILDCGAGAQALPFVKAE